MVELDVQVTRDRRLVIFHDDRLERTTDGAGRVSQASYGALARLDAGKWFGERFAGERILLASDAARLIPARLGINLELKRTRRRQLLVRGLMRLIRRRNLRQRLLLSSFDPRLLEPFAGKQIALALICRTFPEASLRRAVALGCTAWHPHHTVATPRRIARAHAAGLRVHVWTVDDPGKARRVLRDGADGLFTNDPSTITKAVG